jgi:tripartite-type tricarboxylate transporter receptor subunit TctC
LVVSPFATGTTNDIVAHMVLDPAAAQLGQSFMIENRPGGGGTLGVTAVAKAAPDGYTLLLATSALTTSVVLHKSLPYDVGHDFAPVAMFGGAPSLLMAAPQACTVADWLRRRRRAVKLSSTQSESVPPYRWRALPWLAGWRRACWLFRTSSGSG